MQLSGSGRAHWDKGFSSEDARDAAVAWAQIMTTIEKTRLLADPGTPGTHRAQYRVCESAE